MIGLLSNEDKFEKAVRCLVENVEPQAKSGKEKPVVAHSLRIAFHLLSLGYPEEIAMIAILHDVLENSRLNALEIEKDFGSYIREGVEALTIIGKKDSDWPESLKKCETLGLGIMAVRVADLYDNLERQKRLQNKLKVLKYMKKYDLMHAAWNDKLEFEPIWRRLNHTINLLRTSL